MVDDSNIISFRNAKNELIKVEARTEDTIYLVKVSTKLADRIENYDEDDEIIIDDVVEPIKDLFRRWMMMTMRIMTNQIQI
jgi:hypothetical protein